MSDTTIAGKNRLSLDTIKGAPEPEYYEFYFANEHKDKELKLSNINLTGATFVNMGFKESVFRDINFSYAQFENCYFRGAKFENCNFTGCKFVNCNFRKATVISCDLSYSEWKETFIDRGAVLSNLPAYENLARDLLINMRINASSIGEFDDARKYVYESEKYSRLYNWNKFSGNTYKSYTLDKRLGALFSYIRSHTERLFWGYGEKIGNLVVTTVILLLLFGVTYFIKEQTYFMALGGGVVGGLYESIKLSFSVFTSFNMIDINDDIKRRLYNLFLVEAPLGLVFISFLAASLHRKISMRRD